MAIAIVVVVVSAVAAVAASASFVWGQTYKTLYYGRMSK